jgi:hypothetical protein
MTGHRLGWAGGYVGVGVSTSNLAGRTLADLARWAATRTLTALPWVNRRPDRRHWEPEPLRWLGVHGMYAPACTPPTGSLAGQVTDLSPLPARTGGVYDEPCVMHSALQASVGELFFNTGPTGQRAMQKRWSRKMGEMASDGIAAEAVDRSITHGRRWPSHILAWSATDGGAVIGNMGFPLSIPPEPGRRTGCRPT